MSAYHLHCIISSRYDEKNEWSVFVLTQSTYVASLIGRACHCLAGVPETVLFHAQGAVVTDQRSAWKTGGGIRRSSRSSSSSSSINNNNNMSSSSSITGRHTSLYLIQYD